MSTITNERLTNTTCEGDAMSDLTLPSITTSAGTTITLTTRGISKLVVLDHPDAPDETRHIEVGRLVEGGPGFQPGDGPGFQPAPFFPGAMRPEVLRGIADLIEASISTEEAPVSPSSYN